MVNRLTTPGPARIHSRKFLSRFFGAGQRVTDVTRVSPAARGPPDGPRHTRFGPLRGDRPALSHGQRARAPRAQPVTQGSAGTRITVPAGGPQVGQVVRATQYNGHDVINGGRRTAAPVAHAAVTPEHLLAQPPPAGRPLPHSAHVTSVTGESPAPGLPAHHARPCRKTLQRGRGANRVPGPDSLTTPGLDRPPLENVKLPLVSGRGKIPAGPGVVAVWCAGRRFAGGW
jgi:hypothetical protein